MKKQSKTFKIIVLISLMIPLLLLMDLNLLSWVVAIPLAVLMQSMIYGTCIEILMQRDEMSYDDAEEYFEYNVTGAFLGDRMPVFLLSMKEVTVEHIP